MRKMMIRALGLAIVLAVAALVAALPGGAAAQGQGGGASVYCIGVIYKVQAGHEAEAEGYLRRLQEETRKEPGNVMYVVHRSVDDPRQFLIYEQYRSKADLEIHRATAHFQRYAKDGIQKIAESRTGGDFTPL